VIILLQIKSGGIILNTASGEDTPIPLREKTF
jgi:hypothetical protein